MSDWAEMGKRIEALAEQLVRIPSEVDTDGEADVSRFLESHLKEGLAGVDGCGVEYAKVEKPTDCGSVIAWHKASPDTTKTIALMGHFDTVGYEPYKTWRDSALDSPKLKEIFSRHSNEEIKQAAFSPDWNFGRGWLDMKGGIALITETFIEKAKSKELPVNLVLLLTSDEESASLGLRALLPKLKSLLEINGWDLAQVVNADYTSPKYQGDDSKYFYAGTIGKILLGLSVFGVSTHAGEPFDGLNASALGGYLAHSMEHNRKLMQGVGSEWLPPPCVLHGGDRRRVYNVMTEDYAEVYVNLFHTGSDQSELWQQTVHEVRRLVKRYDREMRLRYNRYSARSDERLPRLDERPEVIDYSTLLERVSEQVDDLGTKLAEISEEEKQEHADDRDRALYIIRKLHSLLPPGRPMVVVSVLPPYYPAWYAPRGSCLASLFKEFCRENKLAMNLIYPYIADMSYFAFNDPKGLAALASQAPVWFEDSELELLESVAAPVCNLGPWGSGAHSEEERVYLPYLRDELPKLLNSLLARLARQG